MNVRSEAGIYCIVIYDAVCLMQPCITCVPRHVAPHAPGGSRLGSLFSECNIVTCLVQTMSGRVELVRLSLV